MFPTKDLTALSREELVELVVRLQHQLVQAEATMEALRKQIAELQRAGKRQAAPFSKGTSTGNPKRPGRKPGSGTFSFRKVPCGDEVTEPWVEVPVTRGTCPACGGRLEPERVDVASITDVPPLPRPVVTAYRVQVCRCTGCGKQVRATHPDLAPDQYGASAHRIGARAMAVAHLLHYGVGVPVRKVPAVLQLLTGVTVTQSALTQDALRRTKGMVGSAYQALRACVRDSPVTHTDDTGWRVGGKPAFLMAFETDRATVYQIRPQHRNDEVREIVPSDYQGVLVSDRGRSYDAAALASVSQQKCLAHVLRSISEVVQTKQGRARSFGNHLKGLLREAMELWDRRDGGDALGFAKEAERLRGEVSRNLRDRRLTDRDNQRLLDELGWQHDRGHLLRFLDDPSIPPTNNRAERALRPAVIARKVSHCSKNEAGAEAFAAFTSVLRTLARHDNHSPVEGLCQVFTATPVHASPL